jgi:hypothetical protein
MESNIITTFIYPLFQEPPSSHLFEDQYAFRPSGSTDSALIAILQHITTLLTSNSYVRVIALDFSKAFDTVRHAGILAKLAQLPVEDNVYNWMVSYFNGRSHVTKYNNQTSNVCSINASVVQGSTVGPAMFVINGCDLKPVTDGNYLDKYANDIYLLVPSSNEHSVTDELRSIELWASNNNLKLNKSKSLEMVVMTNAYKRLKPTTVPVIESISRVDSLTILGVTVSNSLSFELHLNNVCTSIAQSLYAIKTLRAHGLDSSLIHTVFNALVVSRLTYGCVAWRGFLNAAELSKLQAVLNKACKWGFYPADGLTFEQICDKRDLRLFNKLLRTPTHVLYPFLPPDMPNHYNFRARAHNKTLPDKSNPLASKNFICRMLFSSLLHHPA